MNGMLKNYSDLVSKLSQNTCGHSEPLALLNDRSKNLIASGGSNIYPREVQRVLLRHPGVREVAVGDAPDAEWGEAVVDICLQHIARGRSSIVSSPPRRRTTTGC
jgi:acyl-CoA synthetase (AMP-forming)/AMP-acid ligase II